MALSKKQRQELFVQQRTAELTAAGKPVNTAALNARFAELGATPEGRKQITAKVQLTQNSPAAPVAAPSPAAAPNVNVPTFADNPGQARIMREREAAAAADETPVATPDETPVATPDETPDETADETADETPETSTTTPTNTGGSGTSVVLPTSTAASDELKAILERFQLGGLFDALNAAVIADKTLAQNTDALFGSVRNNPIYIERFKGNVARIKNGYVPLSEAQYIAQEQSYSTMLKNSGMPKGFYDTKDDFANLMANDISPAELSARIENGYKMVTNAPPEVVNQLKMMVPDITDANLAAYFLDPAKSGTKIEQMARAANIAAQGKTAGGMQLTGTQAQSLAQAGITTQQAQAGFSQIGQQAGLYRPLQGEQDITQEDILAGTFTNEQAAQQRIARRKRGRTATFEAGGSFAQSQQSNIGLTTVGQ